MSYEIQYAPDLQVSDYTPYGGCREFMYCKEPEFIAEGPAETGKTIAACWRIHLMALKYPKLNGAIVRKTQTSIYGSVLQTFDRVIEGAPVEPYGGERPQKYNYSNGSVIWVGGMDKADKILSSERDFFYVNQAEELTLDDWEKLTTRTTGRGAVMPYTMTFGDCNPSHSNHWIKEREKAGHLKMIRTAHRDNPTLFDPATGEITEQGKRTMGRLGALSGVRGKRLRDGIWATAEGAVYDTFDPFIHIKRRDYSEMKYFYMAVDEGYTNPAVVLLVGEDSDGRWHVFKEFYRTGQLQSVVVAQAKRWYDAIIRWGKITERDARVHLVAVDSAAAGLIADMRDTGLPAQAAKGRVLTGIQNVQVRLSVRGDGTPGLTFDPGCRNTTNDFESYVWKKGAVVKDEPQKENDHAPDAIRYLDDLSGRPPVEDLVDFA